MPSPSNMQYIIKSELFKRFESVMKQEMADHEKAISSYHKEMQEMRDSIKYTLQQCDSLFRHNEKEIKETTSDLKNIIDEISHRIRANELSISDQRTSIVSLFQTLQDFMHLSTKKSEFETFKTDVANYVKEKQTCQNIKSENHYRFIENSLEFVNEEIEEIKGIIDQKFSELNEKLDLRLSEEKVNKDGLLKEIRSHEKIMYVMEKKIENLYTLIDRITKRG